MWIRQVSVHEARESVHMVLFSSTCANLINTVVCSSMSIDRPILEDTYIFKHRHKSERLPSLININVKIFFQ